MDEPLVEVAGQIADGNAVDWPSMTSTLMSDEQRAIADELEVVARIAHGHRQLHQLLPAPVPAPARPVTDRSRWGHFELLDIVARGSYGTVYRAWDTRLERLVALKLFHGASNPAAVMQEGRMLARVRHEHVVTVFDADVIDGVAGLWMELVHGRTLDQIVKQDGPLEPREAAAIGLDVARALAAVHGAALLHCDVKAQNVVRETGGRVVLVDLGAGRPMPETSDADQWSDAAGTPRYMAPELFQTGAAASKATDVYSLGVLLYYLVLGRFPVDGRSFAELKRAHLEGRIVPLETARPDLPAGYAALVSSALERDPAKRPASAEEMETALAAIAAPRVPQPAPVVTPARRRWLWAAAGIAATLLGIAILRPSLFGIGPAPPVVWSIAVLPIQNGTGDPEKAYVANGLTEVLIANLARVHAFRVPSFEAVRPYRNTEEAPRELGRKLGVKLLLAGSVTQLDGGVKIDVRLTDAGSGALLWREELTREPAAMLSAQAEIAKKVAAHLRLNLTPAETKALTQSALNPQAQEQYLQGLAIDQSGPGHAKEARAFFNRAVTLEPGFAAAWAALALNQLPLIEQITDADRKVQAQAARDMAQKAILLDPTLAAGYVARGSVEFYRDWNFPAAELTLRQALVVDPSNAFAHARLSMLLAALGRHAEAIAEGRESVALDPLVAQRATTLGIAYYYARDFDSARREAERALSMSPGNTRALLELGRIDSALGRHDAAIGWLKLAVQGSPTPAYLVELARAYAAAGRPAEKRDILDKLSIRQASGEAYSPDNLGYIAAAEGRIDDAFVILDEAVDRHLTNALWIAVDPRVDPLRSDPRFDRLLVKAGLKR